ncbi:hypothetical protein VTO73DRAFT_5231 [Trametes versicolor]
MATCPDLEA